MRTQLVVGLAFATLGVSAIACTSSSNPYAQVGEFCTAYAKAICQVASTCQFDAGACETYQQNQCLASAPTATTTTRTYEASNVQACINTLNSAYGNNATSVSASTLQNYTQLCAKVFQGNVAEGNACTTSLDCASSGAICASAPGMTGSVCSQPTAKGPNDICADPGDECPADYYCAAQTSGSPKCVASQGTGAPCSSTLPCTSETQCEDGTCEPLSGAYATCSSTTSCGSGLFCDSFTDTISPTPQCVSAYSFARGSVDCLGITGQGTTPVVADAGVTSTPDASDSGGSSSGATSDAASD